MKRATILFAMALVVGVIPLAAFAADGNLPGGTAISVTVDDPADGQLFALADTTIDVDVHGTASVGAGTPIKDTTVVYVMDISGSMGAGAGVDCDGIAGNDTRLKCEQEGVAAANAAAADPMSAVDLTGLAVYSSGGSSLDVDLGTGGTQLLVAPDYDGNTNTVPDVEDVARAQSAGGGTSYAAGLSAAVTIISDSANTNTTNIVIFMSDGGNNIGPNVSGVPIPANTTIDSFAIGTGVSCTTGSTYGTLNDVAALSTAGTGTCTQVTDPSDLADVIEESIGSSLDAVTISVNGGPASPADMTNDPLPADGPITTGWWKTVTLGTGLYEICATAYGTDAGGGGSVTECVNIVVYDPDGFVTGGGWIDSPAGALAGLPFFDGSYYELFEASEIPWEEANALVADLSYPSCGYAHLATVTSAEEDEFLVATFGEAPLFGKWLGGFQDPDGEEPAGGWGWITGEPWEYTNWNAGEPNNAGGNEEHLEYWNNGTWNDEGNLGLVTGYLVEYDDCVVGKANFGFVAKYKKGADYPTGNTEFQFHAGDLNFHSSSYEWLVIDMDGVRAILKGEGTINGAGAYMFMLWAYDDEPDKFRIKIWEENLGEHVLYDNGFTGSGFEEGQPLGGGSITIHTKK